MTWKIYGAEFAVVRDQNACKKSLLYQSEVTVQNLQFKQDHTLRKNYGYAKTLSFTTESKELMQTGTYVTKEQYIYYKGDLVN